MPFTIAHTICAVPFYRRSPFIMSALTIGLMAPDMEYFLKFANNSNYGHSFTGLLQFALPSAIMMWLMWEYIFADHLSQRVGAKMPQRSRNYSGFKKVSWMLISIVVGILLHLLLDSFTEYRGVWAQLFPTLYQQRLFGLPFPSFLQYGLSIVLLIWLAVIASQRWLQAPRLSKNKYVLIIGEIIGVAVVSLGLVVMSHMLNPVINPKTFLLTVMLLVRWMTLFMVVYAGYILILKITKKRSN